MSNCVEKDSESVLFWEYRVQLHEDIFMENFDAEFEEAVERLSF